MRRIRDKVKSSILLLHNSVEKGLLLFSALIAAVVIVNTGHGAYYYAFFGQSFAISFNHHELSLTLHEWINDFLMAIFFLFIAMEIKRELVMGYLSTLSQRLLPVISAVSGVIAPLLIYLAFNPIGTVAAGGWAVPVSTDIAFVLGVLALFGKYIPSSLKIFILALAIIDDLIAIIIIAIFYTGDINFVYFVYIAFCVMVLLMMNRFSVKNPIWYLIVGFVVWYCFLRSGVHATISGVVVGLCVPIQRENRIEPAKSLMMTLGPLVSYVIMPLFAFANSDIVLSLESSDILFSSVTLGVGLGLVFGKQIGIFSAVYILVRSGIAKMPENLTMKHFYVGSILCGIGFTMSLFIATISFEMNRELLADAKAGIVLGSLFSFFLGAIALRCINRSTIK